MRTRRSNRLKTTLLLGLLLLTSGIAVAATYTYKCFRCGLVQQYSFPGIRKCPNDGSTMFLQQ